MKKKILRRGALLLGAIVVLVGAALLPASASTVMSSHRLSAAYGELVESVVSYGAKGDGKTDDTGALKAAIAAAEKDGGGAVGFPAGTYRLTKSVDVPIHVELVFFEGASVFLEASSSLRIAGSLVAGNYPIFEGKGLVTAVENTFVGNPCWFGAKGDGKTDDTQAFQKTIDLFGQIDIPYSEQGYVISGLTILKPTVLQGAGGQKAKLIASSSAQNLITIRSSQVNLYHLSFDMAAAAEATCVFFDDSALGLERCNVKHIEATDAYRVIRDADHPTNMVVTTAFEDIVCRDGRGTAFECNDMWGFMFLTNVTVDYSGSAEKHGITVDFPGVFIKDNAGYILTNVKVIGDPGGTKDAHGFDIKPGAAMWFRDCSAENVSGSGMNMTSSSWVYVIGFTARNCVEGGVTVKGGYMNQFLDTTVIGSDATNDRSDGITVQGGSHFQFTNTKVQNLPRNGMNFVSITRSVISGFDAQSCGGYGLRGSVAENVVTSVTGSSNGKGNTSLSD